MPLSSTLLPLLPPTLFWFPFLLLPIAFWSAFSFLRLRHVPGPFLAALTNIPRLSWVLTGRAHEIHIALHQRYGTLVRFGPNMVSVGDPAEIPNILGFGTKFTKSDFYHVLLFYAQGKPVPTIFATQDERVHHALKRPIASIYSMSNLMSFERFVDSTMQVFSEQLDRRFVETGDVCDLGVWLQRFAFDVIGEITFSKRLGFLERAEDVDGITESIWKYFKKASPVSQMPWLDWVWTKNPVLQRLRSVRANPIVGFAVARAQERQKVFKDSEKLGSELNSRDFLSRFLDVLSDDPSIPPEALTAWTTSNITAGSDTTAMLLRTIFYNLLQHPSDLHRLLSELDEADRQNPLSSLVTWKETRGLGFLDACIKEAGRMHPPFGLPLERVVPPGGATICGQRFEGGTVVGMSGWVIHRNRATFGEDSDVWRPQRWLEGDEAARKKMESRLLTFGAGNRICLGRNISYLEVYKLVPTLFRLYEIEFADANNTKWHVENRWFVNQTGLKVRLKKREVRRSQASEKP